MSSELLTRIAKDFLNWREPPTGERYRMGWAGAVLEAPPEYKKKRTSPRLAAPLQVPKTTSRPACYFSRGASEANRRLNPTPIPYLLTETFEMAEARPVPGNVPLLRSICKGKGVLQRNSQGMIFLDIDNRFVSTLMPYLKGSGLVQPPYFKLAYIPDGAHTPVIPAREMAFQYLDEIEEIGKEFHFEVEGLYSMEPVSWPEVEQVWFFKLHSPELENLRRRYFLPATPCGHPFHIVIGVKPKATVVAQTAMPYMRINSGYSAA